MSELSKQYPQLNRLSPGNIVTSFSRLFFHRTLVSCPRFHTTGHHHFTLVFIHHVMEGEADSIQLATGSFVFQDERQRGPVTKELFAGLEIISTNDTNI